MNRIINAIMGQDSSQEVPTDAANTPADPTRTPSDNDNQTNRVFEDIADAMDASQNRRKSHLLQANSPDATQIDHAQGEHAPSSPESRKKKHKHRHSSDGRDAESKKSKKKDKHRKSTELDSSQLIPDVETFEPAEQPSEQQDARLQPASDDHPEAARPKQKLTTTRAQDLDSPADGGQDDEAAPLSALERLRAAQSKPYHSYDRQTAVAEEQPLNPKQYFFSQEPKKKKKSKDVALVPLSPSGGQETSFVAEGPEHTVAGSPAAASASQKRLKKSKHKKNRETAAEDAVPEEEYGTDPTKTSETMMPDYTADLLAALSASEPKSKMSKHKKKTAAENAVPVIAHGNWLIQTPEAIMDAPTDDQTTTRRTAKSVKKRKSKDKKALKLAASQTLAAEEGTASENAQPLSPEAAAEGEEMDVIPESSLPLPTTPSAGNKKKMKTFMSAQKKKILLEQASEHDTDAIPPTQLSQAEETQVQNSYETNEAHVPTEADADSEGQEAEVDEQSDAPDKTKKSTKPKNVKYVKKRRLPIDDATDTPSKRARLDIQPPLEAKPKAKRKTVKKHPTEEQNKGMLSEKDWETIELQLEKYRAMNDLTVEEQNRLIQGKVGGKSSPSAALFDWVMEEIHDRARWSVIKAMRRRYHDFDKRAAWAPEDDEELIAVHARLGNKWTEIGSLLNRLPDDCRDRWRYVLVCGTNINYGKWTLEEEQLLMQIVDDALNELRSARQERALQSGGEEDEEPLDEAAELNLLDWQVVSDRMGLRRGRRQCSEKYKVLQKREPARWASLAKSQGKAILQASRMKLKDKIVLLKALQESAVFEEDDVDWDGIAQEIIDHDEEGNISKLSSKSAKKAWEKLKFLVENANSLEFQGIVGALLEKLENCGDEDPSEELFEARIGNLDLTEKMKVRTDLGPAKHTKMNIVQAAALTLEEKRDILAQVHSTGAENEEEVDWLMFSAGRSIQGKSPGNWAAKKLAFEKMLSFLDSTEEEPPTEFENRVQFMLEKLNSADEDPTKSYFMEEVAEKSAEDELEKWEEKKAAILSAEEDEKLEAVKEKAASMPDWAKLKVLHSLRDANLENEKDIRWSKHGDLNFMKKCLYNAHVQREMLNELKVTVEDADELDFADLLDKLIANLDGAAPIPNKRKPRARRPRGEAAAQAKKSKDATSDAPKRTYNRKTRNSSKAVEDSDDEVADDILDSLNAAANPQDDDESDAAADESGSESATMTLEQSSRELKKMLKSQKRAESPLDSEKSEPEAEVGSGDEEDEVPSAPVSPVATPSPKKSKKRADIPAEDEFRKDPYEFDEDEMDDIVLKSAMKRRTPKKIDEPVEEEQDDDESDDEDTPQINLEVENEDQDMPDVNLEVEDSNASITNDPTPPADATEEAAEGTAATSDTGDSEIRNEPSPPPAASSSHKGKRSKNEKRREEVEESQEGDEGPSALDILAALSGSQTKARSVSKAAPVQDTIENAIPPTSSLLPTMSQVVRESMKKRKKAKRSSEAREIPETQEENLALPAADADAVAMPPPSLPAPSLPPSSSLLAPFPDIPATDDEMPPSSMIPPSSPPQPLVGKKKKAKKVKLSREEKAALQTQVEKSVRPRPSLGADGAVTPAEMDADPFAALLTRSLKKTRKSLKREAEQSVEELEAQENGEDVVATQTPDEVQQSREGLRAMPPFTPRASRRQRKPTQKAMTPYK